MTVLKTHAVSKSITSLACAKNAKTGPLGDIMIFYIAQRSNEARNFQIWEKEGKPHEFRNIKEAVSSYETAIRFEGIKNVLLLEEVNVKIDLTVSLLPLKKEVKQ